MKLRLLLLFLSLLNLGCSKKISSGKVNKNSEKIAEYSEDLTVFRPKYEKIEPLEKPQIINSSTLKIDDKKEVNETTVLSDTQAVNDILKQIANLNSQITEGQGYRIQVFSGNNKQEFENVKSYLFRFHSDLELYESYSQPTYRIKVGDFLNRNDAEKQFNSLNARFQTMRIISDKINIKKALEVK
jgi:hypothetical protein